MYVLVLLTVKLNQADIFQLYNSTMLSVIVLVVVLAISQAYDNIALNKSTYQQSPYKPGDDTYDASNAVDGRKSDLSWGGGQCAASLHSTTAIWWVNLTTIHSIHHITIYFRTDNEGFWYWKNLAGYYLGFSVYISDTTDIARGTLCFKDNNFTINTIPPVFTTNCFVHGQYVIYYNERLPEVAYPDAYKDDIAINLCEVEVYGCHKTGYYTSNCSIPCPDVYCQHCHIEKGACQGCKPGQQCELECDRGFFGIGCNEKCGHCRDEYQCSNETGVCLTGCGAGYKGDLCKTRCDKGSYGVGCNETCGHCRDLNQCSNVNGSCLTGCGTGYQGDLCKPRIIPLIYLLS
ncbi:protein glp-1-like isoform X2 [Crassostrea angulata]|uniref:protein glp-1-like isoform X2 n=1 Tax=Magallana angulata TaxID=2784310 RepID=UPI0022B1F061|nr:protein glp-1-like isoform X2 [Crassostrea angulata]